MRTISLLTVLWLLWTGVSAGDWQGHFESEGTVLYFVHRGGALEFDIRISKVASGFRGTPPLKVTESALFTLSDPEEKVVEKQYWRKEKDGNGKTWSFRYRNAAPGVWQLRTSLSNNSNLSLEFNTNPRLPYGVLFSRCKIYAADFENLRNRLFLVPEPLPNLNGPAKKQPLLRLTSRGIQTDVLDREGRPLLSCDVFQISGARSEFPGNANIELPFGSTEVSRDSKGAFLTLTDSDNRKVLELAPDNTADIFLRAGGIYRLNIAGAPQGWITIEGLPAILCPDMDTLKKIGGSVWRDIDGKEYPHRFQVEIRQWIRSLKESDLAVTPVPLERYRTQWLSDPANEPLIRSFAFAGHLFKVQNTTLSDEVKYNDSPVRLDDFILIYTLDKPFNPYFRNRAVMNRLFLYYLKKWLCLTESGFMWDDPRGYYCGGAEWSGAEGMLFCQDSLALAFAAPYADRKLTKLLEAGLELNLHRLWNARLTCENQSLHWPLKTYALWKATGEKIYLDMARDYLADVANPALSRSMKTGYLMEALGADGTYAGISTSMLALAARFSGDDAALPLLKRVFDFMSYTITREPDGSLSGVNAFAHRTLGTWLNRQYDGGAELLSDKIESAALVNKRTDPDRASLEKKFAVHSKVCVPDDIHPWIPGGENLFRYSLWSFDFVWRNSLIRQGKDIPSPKTPSEKSDSFECNFNNEFVATRTPSYYVFFHTGNAGWRYHLWRYFDSPFPDGAKLENGRIHSQKTSRPWMPVQGLDLFWTPRFGKFVSGHNWTMYSHNMVRIDRGGKVVDFPTSYSCESKIREGEVELFQQTKFEGICIRRTFNMKKDSLNVTIDVSAPGKISPCQLVEQIPYLRKKGLTFSGIGDGIRRLRVSLPSGAGVLLEFSRPVTVRQGPISTAVQNPPEYEIGLLEVLFDQSFDGTKNVFTYQIKADDAK